MEMENDPEKDNRALFHLSSTTGDGEAMTKSYHLPLTHDPNRSRQALRRKLVADAQSKLLRDPEILMTPPANLPYFVEKKLLGDSQDVYMHSGALANTANARTQFCTTASLTWEASTADMRSKLQDKGNEISRLELSSSLYRIQYRPYVVQALG